MEKKTENNESGFFLTFGEDTPKPKVINEQIVIEKLSVLESASVIPVVESIGEKT